MKPARTRFNPALEPITGTLPTALAETIGRAIARHSYLEWVMGQVLYSLLEISIKQGRKVMQRPSPRAYAAAVQGLFAFHKIEGKFDFDDFARRLEKADRARDAFAHSVYMTDANARGMKPHLVHGCWAIDDPELTSRDGWPDAPLADRAMLARLRKDIEDAVQRAEKLQAVTDRLLRELHDRRRTNPLFNRRRGERR
jgi:hypothetical protein